MFFFFSSRRRHTRWTGDWSSDVCSSDLEKNASKPACNQGSCSKGGASKMYSTLLLDYSKERATITLNRPDKRNAINPPMIADLQSALDEIEKKKVRVVIMAAAGSVFCSGMDLEMLSAIGKQSPQENQDGSRRMAKLFRRIWSFPRPIIAAVNGHALAGGCGIATLCDFTLSVPEAQFGYTEVRIGFLPAIVS